MSERLSPESPPIPWPQPGDRLFAEPRSDSQLVASLSSPRDRWFTYADGYKQAAVRLYQDLCRVERGLDCVIYPLLYAWRHYLELELKALLPPLRYLTDDSTPGVPYKHQLKVLWKVARPMLERVGGDDPVLDLVETVILELDAVDPSGEAFRYPTLRDGTASVRVSPQQVDVQNVHEVMLRVASFLGGCHDGVDAYVGMKTDNDEIQAAYESEMRAEYEAEMRSMYGDQGEY